MNPLAIGVIPVFLGWRALKGVANIAFSPTGAAVGISASKSVFAATVQMKQDQEIIIQQQLDAGQLEIAVPYDDDTLNKLFVVSVLPEIALLLNESRPQNRARTQVVLRALQQLITPNIRNRSIAGTSLNGFPLVQARMQLEPRGLRNQLNALAIVFDYIETEKLSSDSGWMELLEEQGRTNAILQSVDDITGQVAQLNYDSYGIDGTASVLEEAKMDKALKANLSLYPIVDSKDEPYFILSRLADYDVDYEFDEEGLPSSSVSGGQRANIEQLYVDVNDYVEIDDKRYYSTFAWVDDDWEVLGQISEFDEVEMVGDQRTVFRVSRQQAQEDVAEQLIGRLNFTAPLEAPDDLAKAIAKNPQIGKVYTSQSGFLFTAKTIGGRLLWVDTAILLATGAVSLFVPKVEPFSPIGEGLTALFDFVGQTLDLNPQELIPAIDEVNLDAGIFAIASQLFALDEIRVGFTPTAETIVRDLNLDGRTFGIALTKAGLDASFKSLRAYDSWDVLTILAITVIIVGLLRQIPAFFKS